MTSNKTPKPSSKSPEDKPVRRRARTQKGEFKGNNPEAPSVEDAWVPTDISQGLSTKAVTKELRPLIGGPSTDTSGKYSKSKKVTPGFGGVRTTYH